MLGVQIQYVSYVGAVVFIYTVLWSVVIVQHVVLSCEMVLLFCPCE
jgi:hypothetical protein